MMGGKVKDYTWPICKDCMYRVMRTVYVTWYDQTGKEEQRVEPYYMCLLGKELDRHPDECRYKVPRIPQYDGGAGVD
jgi:hypothetical protein